MSYESKVHIDTGEHEWFYYKLDPVIAQRIKELRCGLNGCNTHSWRALAIAVTGNEDQGVGQELQKAAEWTLGEEWK